MSKLSVLLPEAQASKRKAYQAAGSISSGQTVSLRSDGTVEASSSGNYTNFIGISENAMSNGDIDFIIISGGLSEAVTGLTTNAIYYVQSNGSLSTTVSSVKAGLALSSTSILLGN